MLQISQDLGFVDFGVAKVQKLDEAALKWGRYVDSGNAAEMDFLKRNLEVRGNPELLEPGAKTIFVFLAPYSLHNDGSGIASFAYGIDYHTVIKGKLRQ
ncbi:MAG: DUF1730 domain-containing protein, partial [Bacteroidales bacterium]|nr:DUF1730 domain-containing protein [Bacteroidales bacterium]